MFRFRSQRLIRLYSNGFQSLLMQTRYQKNVNKLPLNSYTTQSDVTGAASSLSKISDNLREKRLNSLKRNTISSEWDVLSESIIKATTIEQIIELLSFHINVMNSKHMSSVFESINNIVKLSDNSNEESLKILSSDQFKQLCNQTVKRIRFFQTTEVLTTLKCLINLNLSPNTTVVQSLLQMTRQFINDFSINEIIFLEFLLRKQIDERRQESDDIPENEITDEVKSRPKTVIPLVEALKLAIPLVLQLKIESKEIDLDDIELVCKCLRIAAKHNLKDEVINKLTTTVSHHLHALTNSQTFSVIASLISLTTVNTNINTNLTERVLNNCLNRVTESGVGLTPGAHHNLLVSMILNNKSRRTFYHKGLYEMVANIVTQNPDKFNNYKVTSVLWSLTKHQHVHYGLLDLVANKLYQKDLDLIDSPKTSFTNILQAFALPSNYRLNETNSEVVYKNILSSNHIMLSKQQKTKHLLFKILKYFAVLNYYPKEEIRDWIENHLESALSQSTLLNFRIEFIENLLILYQGLCLESNFDDCQDLKKVLKPLIEEYNDFQSKLFEDKYKSNTLEFALTQGLGGHQFIASNVISDFGHNIDHLIVMRKGGYPVSIDTESLKKPVHISDLKVPDDSDLIGIIPLTQKDYCREPVIKKGETDFRLRTLNKTGIITIPVNLEGWESLAEIEKIPYIMRKIQENLDSKQIEKI